MRSPPSRLSVIGVLMTMLALVGQVTLGSAVRAQPAPGSQDAFASLAAGFPICHAGEPGTADDGGPTEHSHHGGQCALCPACHALAAAAVLPVPTSVVPAPQAAPLGRHSLRPPARGPPATAVLAATYPTGPPRLA